MKPELVPALIAARRRMTAEVWRASAERLSNLASILDGAAVDNVIAGIPNHDAAWALKSAIACDPELPGIAIGAVMLTVDQMDFAEVPRTELIWTGPGNSRFPIRRIDQVLYDLIATAQRRILLVTFAAHRVPHLCRHLETAIRRGVKLTLIVESEEESEGQLSWDAKAAFPGLPEAGAAVYYWPLAKRVRNQAGRPGKLHAKCAVVDDTALISSANMTDDAFNRNMELGVLIKEASTVATMLNHFDELAASRELLRV
jgi:phosphatidylserine/phosphatidylglycerophosphate/cardiolipin synthase-like enzyme